MNLHGRARSCPFRRRLFVDPVLSGKTAIEASCLAGFSKRTSHKWLRRFRRAFLMPGAFAVVVVLMDIFGKLLYRSDAVPGFLDHGLGGRIISSDSMESRLFAGVVVAPLVAFVLEPATICLLHFEWKHFSRKGSPPDHMA